MEFTGLGEITPAAYVKILHVDMELLRVYQPNFTSLHAYGMASYIFSTLKMSGENGVDKQIMRRNIALGFPKHYPQAKFEEEFEKAWSYLKTRLL